MAKKLALLVGCNYPGTDSELRGCVNDAMHMRTILTSRFGFAEADIMLLVDTNKSGVQPTAANIRKHLNLLITKLRRGDVLVFHYSGHGTRLPAEAGGDINDNTGWDEAIVPTDMNILTDDDFRNIVTKIPAGVAFTFISDSCNSGGLIDETKEQIGDAEKIHQQGQKTSKGNALAKPKKLSVDQLTRMLSQRSGHKVEVGNIRTTLYDLFGDEASITVKSFQNLVLQQIKEEKDEAGLVGTVSPLAVNYVQSKFAENLQENYLAPCESAGVYRPRSQRTTSKGDDVGMLLSGCQSHELSFDIPGDNPGDAYGAFSKGIETVLGQKNKGKTNRKMILAVRKWLMAQGFNDQHPCLYCSDKNSDAVFICDYV